MSTILLSIKPEYANRIFLGQKKYEFRKRLANKKIDKIVVYSSSPVQKVIGEVAVTDTLSMRPTPLWEATKNAAGISRGKYREYFAGCKMASAYKLGDAKLYNTPRSLLDYEIHTAPQSFVYLKK
ncbi:hypothetical protein [Pygmaiobacter massiliensis]|uniref:hypothetical protein n=1 Tax=Pygmaiobacter massiliensis TaxID=1917873 RepID=UPI00289E7A14|nr:hypothetical protein [Pygmaiobacter massiliensis]